MMQATSQRSNGNLKVIVNIHPTENFYPEMAQERILKVNMESVVP